MNPIPDEHIVLIQEQDTLNIDHITTKSRQSEDNASGTITYFKNNNNVQYGLAVICCDGRNINVEMTK